MKPLAGIRTVYIQEYYYSLILELVYIVVQYCKTIFIVFTRLEQKNVKNKLNVDLIGGYKIEDYQR